MTDRVVNRSEYPARHFLDHKNVTLEPWSEEWSSTFREDAKMLRRVLNSSNLVVNIHHVGSTSIQGLMAKPIVDIMMEVTSIEDFDKHRKVLEVAGYIWCGAPFYGGRYLYNLHKADSGTVRSHLHVVESPMTQTSFALLQFRDALRKDEKLLKEYARLKVKLAKDYSKPEERHLYTQAKSAFVNSVVKNEQEKTNAT